MVALAIELDLERKQRIAISEKYSSFILITLMQFLKLIRKVSW